MDKREEWKKRIIELEEEVSELIGQRSKTNSKISYKRKKLAFLYDSNPDQLDLFQIKL
jgi:hypothetical protein